MHIEPLISTRHFTHIAERRRLVASLRDLKGSLLYPLLRAGAASAEFDLIHPETGRITHWLMVTPMHGSQHEVVGWEFSLQYEQAILFPEIRGYTLVVLND